MPNALSITGFCNFLIESMAAAYRIAVHWKPTTIIAMHLFVFKSRPPIQFDHWWRITCWWRQLSVFINKTNEGCFLFHGSDLKKKQSRFFMLGENFVFIYSYNALKYGQKSKFSICKHFWSGGSLWIQSELTGLQLNRVFAV